MTDARRGFLRNLALILWAVALCVVCVRVTVQTRHKQSGYEVYYKAGMHWRHGEHLYRHPDDYAHEHVPPDQRQPGRPNIAWGGFRYLPITAIAFVPLSYLPMAVGEVVWRVFLAALSLGALWWCCRLGLPRPLARRDWPIIFLLVLFAFTGCLNNGQSSCIVIGCMLAAIACVTTERWTLAALCMACATLLKIYPLSLGLLLAVAWPRRFAWRYALMLALGLALPFLLRPGAWIMEEHRRWLWHLLNDAIQPETIHQWDHDVRLLLVRVAHLRLSPHAFVAIELAAGALIGAVCIGGIRARWSTRRLLTRMLGLSVCWMTVLGQATEPSTYVLVAPTLAWAMWESTLRPHTRFARASRVVLFTSYALFITAYVALWFPKGKQINGVGLEPLAGVLLFGYLLVECARDLIPRAGGRQAESLRTSASVARAARP
ncbi:MAG: hypothetical protein JWN51_2156 [Phycisphaerales bacterium]|nr:hypothetical protein [Phycisphaerales bacterium]